MSDLVSRQAVKNMVNTWTYDMMDAEDVERALHDVDELQDAQQSEGDTVSRKAVIDAIEKLHIPEDMCVFEILSHIELAIGTLPSAEPNLQPTCNRIATDCISRQDLITSFRLDDDGKAWTMDEIIYRIRQFPSVDETQQFLQSAQPEGLVNDSQQ